MALPPQLRDAPEVAPGLELYYHAFQRLSTCRPVGMGLGPIPWTSIKQYAILQELDQLQSEALEYHISRMDSAFLDRMNKKD